MSTADKIHFSCRNCGLKLVAKAEQAGRTGQCKNCHHDISVPNPNDPKYTPPPAEVLTSSVSRQCQVCGSNVQDDLKLCRDCGAEITSKTAEPDLFNNIKNKQPIGAKQLVESTEHKSTEVIDSIQSRDGSFVEVISYPNLLGSSDIRTAEKLFFARQSGMHLKMVRIRLKNSSVRIEPGSLYFMTGNLEMKSSTGGGLMKGIARKMVSKESFFVNEIRGTGDVYLEPTFGHFLLHRIEAVERGVIVDKSLFYAATEGLDISAAAQKNVSSALFGGEGFFQTKITGTGCAVLFLPIPKEEVLKFELHGNKLSVDGNFALMRSESIKFKAEKSGKTWATTAVSGEGLLQTFEGYGSVWLAPTQTVYEKLSTSDGLEELTQAQGSRHTKTRSGK